jgi:hypothetical protein
MRDRVAWAWYLKRSEFARMKPLDPIAEAAKLPNGARFFRCALQVNPFEYLVRHSKTTPFKTEDAYNRAIVAACKENGIEAIAVADHYRVRTSEGLATAAREAGIAVFPGFEAVTKEGVHVLCLFSPDRDLASLDRILGDCGVLDDSATSPTGKYDVGELLEASRAWGALCIAAHVAAKDGLLGKLSGQPRINAWRSSLLLACALPGPLKDAPQGMRAILSNENPEHKRAIPIAIVNAQDVQAPEELAASGSSCWIKMSKVSIEGLRQAFLDPASRIRLDSDEKPEPHAEFVSMAWQGGFLDGAAVRFNENLNVLIGGRGTGKSTVIESIRYVLGLEPVGEEAKKAHEGIVRHVLRAGTKISLLVRSHRPKLREYRIERTIPNPVVVRDDSGQVASLTPADIVPRAEVYGQHEISELAKSPDKLTRVLERFAKRAPGVVKRKFGLSRELERSRAKILELQTELKAIEERLAALPALEETLRAFQDAGLEGRLKERSVLVREERVLKTALERVQPFIAVLDALRQQLPIDRAFLSAKALDELPGKETLRKADSVLEEMSQEFDRVASAAAQAIATAQGSLKRVENEWGERQKAVLLGYEKILRELQRSKVDGEEFIRLRHNIEELRPMRERSAQLSRELKENEGRRANLLAEWEDAKSSEFRELKEAADRVTRALAGAVRVNVTFAGTREPLLDLVREVGGRLSESLDKIQKKQDLSLSAFAAAARAGRDALVKSFGLPSQQADRIAQAPLDLLMHIEELDLPPTAGIELNVAAEHQPADWQALERLSTGQKATAVLLLLLLESDAPLVVDQPEDDLDNRFITEGVVPKMREEKRHRQFVFATHNANVLVLGDAELILGLVASGEATQGKAQIAPEHMASIDTKEVRELVEEILEGGKAAFEMRRMKYGF